MASTFVSNMNEIQSTIGQWETIRDPSKGPDVFKYRLKEEAWNNYAQHRDYI